MCEYEDITQEQIDILDSMTGWLDTQIINSYHYLISQRYSKVFCVDTYFYTAIDTWDTNLELSSDSIAKINKCLPPAESFSTYDKFLIPIYEANRRHWTLVCADFSDRVLMLYDSYHSPTLFVGRRIAKYFERYYLKDNKEWRVCKSTNNPRQTNSYECGVFVCKESLILASSQELFFSQQDMPAFRQEIKRSLLERRIL